MNEPSRPLRVLVVASEAVGFAKTGGLADVVGSLPRALARRGIDVRVAMPLYSATHRAKKTPEPTDVHFDIQLGHESHHGQVWWSYLNDSEVPIYLIDQPHFFARDGLYQHSDGGNKRDYPDNGERFLFFCRAAIEMLPRLDFWPDVIHCNDWQTGMIPVYLRELYGRHFHRFDSIRTLMTIHNIAYQGHFSPSLMGITGLDHHLFTSDKLEFYGSFSFLKAGVVYADWISTVSPRYAEEIQTAAYGCGLEGMLRSRHQGLTGIVNGVDYHDWNPATDRFIPAPYDVSNVFEKKPTNKAALQRFFNLPEWGCPVFGVVARLAEQKGIELLLEIGEQILHRDSQIVLLGEGDQHYHYWIQNLRDRYPDRVGVYFGFNEGLAHLIEAGSDAFLMPSKYEPSGLNQLYSLKYGTVPVVRAVGGLHDTIYDCNDDNLHAGLASGFRFGDYNGGAFLHAIERAMHVYRHRQDVWKQLVQNGMKQDWSWDRSAGDYDRLYRRIAGVH